MRRVSLAVAPDRRYVAARHGKSLFAPVRFVSISSARDKCVCAVGKIGELLPGFIWSRRVCKLPRQRSPATARALLTLLVLIIFTASRYGTHKIRNSRDTPSARMRPRPGVFSFIARVRFPNVSLRPLLPGKHILPRESKTRDIPLRLESWRFAFPRQPAASTLEGKHFSIRVNKRDSRKRIARCNGPCNHVGENGLNSRVLAIVSSLTTRATTVDPSASNRPGPEPGCSYTSSKVYIHGSDDSERRAFVSIQSFP